MQRIIPLCLLIFICTFNEIHAQDVVEFKGKILREDSLTPVYGAVIYNKNKMLGTLTNKLGNFKMRVSIGDTIQVSHITFMTQYIVFNELDFKTDDVINFILKIRSYELPGIDVRRFRIRERRQEPTTMQRTDNITYSLGTIRLENPGGYLSSPWSGASNNMLPMPVFGIPIGDWNEMKRQAQLAIVKQEEAKEKKRKYLSFKYSKKLVNNLTGLKGNELENFMNFCKPSDETILKANEYEMTYLILDCYNRFKTENE